MRGGISSPAVGKAVFSGIDVRERNRVGCRLVTSTVAQRRDVQRSISLGYKGLTFLLHTLDSHERPLPPAPIAAALNPCGSFVDDVEREAHVILDSPTIVRVLAFSSWTIV